jgi:hypothetical protein
MSSLKRRNWDGPSSQRFFGRHPTTLSFIACFFIISLLIYIAYINLQTLSNGHHHIPVNSITVNKSKDEPLNSLRTLPSEIAFRLTLRDCIPGIQKENGGEPAKECLQQTPTGSTARQRIALMSPDHRVRNLVYEWLQQVLLILYNHDQLRLSQELELISTSHVPPYGYGGTHGYTKIIRLVRLPLSVHFIDSATWNSSTSFTVEDLQQVTRQVIRWHCRLSHVAAHTALFTVQVTDISMPWSELLHFILSSPQDEDHNLLPLALMESETIRERILKLNQKFFQTLNHPNGINQVPSQSYWDTMEVALSDELAKTKQLQAWPCLSFWDVGGDSQQSQFVASQLIPQCSAPWTTCVVEKDRCEERKDPTCS